MPDGAVKPVFKPDGGIFEQGTGTADHPLELVELIGCGVFIRLQQKFQQGWDDADTGDVLLMEPSPEQTRLEFSVEHGAAFAIEGRDERDDGSVDVVDRQDAHQAIELPKRMPSRDGVGVDEEVVRGEDDALRRTGRSRRIHD